MTALFAIQTCEREQAGRKGIEWAIYCLARDQRGGLRVGFSGGDEFKGDRKDFREVLGSCLLLKRAVCDSSFVGSPLHPIFQVSTKVQTDTADEVDK